MAASVGERLRLRLLHWSSLLTRPMSLGVRGIVISPDDEVLLVRHGYVSGWHFPGGGVEVGETTVESLTRELEEEARIAIEGPPVLHGLFFNTQISKRDHVAAYVVRNFRVLGERAPNWEILEARFFGGQRFRKERPGALERGLPSSSILRRFPTAGDRDEGQEGLSASNLTLLR